MILRLPLVFRGTAIDPSQLFAKPTQVPKPSKSKTYTVQPGDYLVALAQQFDLDWYNLAVLNDIPYPYVIYPGQVLRLR